MPFWTAAAPNPWPRTQGRAWIQPLALERALPFCNERHFRNVPSSRRILRSSHVAVSVPVPAPGSRSLWLFPFPASLECGKVSPRFLSETTGVVRLILEELSNLGNLGALWKKSNKKNKAIGINQSMAEINQLIKFVPRSSRPPCVNFQAQEPESAKPRPGKGSHSS